MQVNMNYRKASAENQAKNLARLRDLMAINRTCADCPEPNPDWAAINLGVFVCLRCSGLHRQLGVHVSKVKSCTMDLWNTEWVKGMRDVGNRRANLYYLSNMPGGVKTPDKYMGDAELLAYMRDKYEFRKYGSKVPLKS